MKFAFVAKHRGTWPVRWMCEALGVSRSGFHAWLTRPPSKRARTAEETGARVRASFLASDRTYGARRVWRDVLAEGISCGLHKIERLMRAQALRARPRRRGLPKDEGDRLLAALSPNLLDRQFEAPRPNQKWIADFTYFSSLKTERTARKTYRTRDQAKADVFDYIERFYNAKRRHSTLGYLSPMDFERQASLA
jgi:putative transposase